MGTVCASELNGKKCVYLYENADNCDKVGSESKDTLLKDLMYDYLQNYVAEMIKDVADGKLAAEKLIEILLEDVNTWYDEDYIEDVGWVYEVELK